MSFVLNALTCEYHQLSCPAFGVLVAGTNFLNLVLTQAGTCSWVEVDERGWQRPVLGLFSDFFHHCFDLAGKLFMSL